MSEISVLGAGSWGTVLSDLLAKNNNEVKIWTRNKFIYEEILNLLRLQKLFLIQSELVFCENFLYLVYLKLI